MWALLLSRTSAMMNPHEYREIMLAAFHWNDRTVDDVIADQKARHETQRDSRRPGRRGVTSSPPPLAERVSQTELQKMQALLAAGGSQTTADSGD